MPHIWCKTRIKRQSEVGLTEENITYVRSSWFYCCRKFHSDKLKQFIRKIIHLGMTDTLLYIYLKIRYKINLICLQWNWMWPHPLTNTLVALIEDIVFRPMSLLLHPVSLSPRCVWVPPTKRRHNSRNTCTGTIFWVQMKQLVNSCIYMTPVLPQVHRNVTTIL